MILVKSWLAELKDKAVEYYNSTDWEVAKTDPIMEQKKKTLERFINNSFWENLQSLVFWGIDDVIGNPTKYPDNDAYEFAWYLHFRSQRLFNEAMEGGWPDFAKLEKVHDLNQILHLLMLNFTTVTPERYAPSGVLMADYANFEELTTCGDADSWNFLPTYICREKLINSSIYSSVNKFLCTRYPFSVENDEYVRDFLTYICEHSGSYAADTFFTEEGWEELVKVLENRPDCMKAKAIRPGTGSRSRLSCEYHLKDGSKVYLKMYFIHHLKGDLCRLSGFSVSSTDEELLANNLENISEKDLDYVFFKGEGIFFMYKRPLERIELFDKA